MPMPQIFKEQCMSFARNFTDPAIPADMKLALDAGDHDAVEEVLTRIDIIQTEAAQKHRQARKRREQYVTNRG